jgi:hypothetical protein
MAVAELSSPLKEDMTTNLICKPYKNLISLIKAMKTNRLIN